jgi:succinate dehydrogenase / fumarate reductase cytochrome b subunit
MNIVVIISPEGYNTICATLGANWYAIVGTSVLAAGFVIHIIYAFYLTYQNKAARGTEAYAVTSSQAGVSWASKNMVALGGIILGFLVLHLYNFWFKMQFAEWTGNHTGSFDPADGAAYVVELFSNKAYCVIYIVWLIALWFHLTHGIWSALQTTGLNNKVWLPRVKRISNVISTIIVMMFMAIPLYFLIGCGACC